MDRATFYLIILGLIFAFYGTAQGDSKCRNVAPGGLSDKGLLWKPVSEHTKYPVICTLPRGDIQKVKLLTKDRKKILTVPFRSTGDAGDCWQNFTITAKQLKRKYKRIRVRVIEDDGCRDTLIKDPCRRSDGKPGEGNC